MLPENSPFAQRMRTVATLAAFGEEGDLNRFLETESARIATENAEIDPPQAHDPLITDEEEEDGAETEAFEAERLGRFWGLTDHEGWRPSRF